MRTNPVLLILILCGLLAAAAAPDALALPADHYAPSSAMAKGKWVKIKTGETGMYSVSNAELRRLGFADPSKVNVYGLGGRELSTALNATLPADIPMLPCVRTADGLTFYAAGIIRFNTNAESETAAALGHTVNSYSNESVYFLSDSPEGLRIEAESYTTPGAADPKSTVNATIVHELELEPKGTAGGQYYGEDFRSKPVQTFDFKLPGKAADDVKMRLRFVAKTTSGASSVKLTANGTHITAGGQDLSVKVSTHEYFNQYAEANYKTEVSGDNLQVKLEYSYSGVLFMARLDYLEVHYKRALRFEGSELLIQDRFDRGDGLRISGVTDGTRIWDVSRPEAPVEVEFERRGTDALFTVDMPGLREFVVFDAAKINRPATSAGEVANQDIHSLPTPDMVIITHPEYREGAQRIASLHERHDGFRVHVVDAGEVYNEFGNGSVDVGAFRRMLKMWHDRGEDPEGHKLDYCLLMGKPLFDNKMLSETARTCGFRPMPIFESYDGYREQDAYCNDDWIGMLDDVAESSFKRDKSKVHVGVGRLPVTSAKGALEAAAKAEKYATEPVYGPWRNKIMLIADDADGGAHLNQSEITRRNITSSNAAGKAAIIDLVYLDAFPLVMSGVGPTYPQATEKMMRNYNDGVMAANYIGHASAKGWGHEHLWEWPSITSMTNRNLMFMYTSTCSFALMDDIELSGAEMLMNNPTAGAIAMITATRSVQIGANGTLNNAFGRRLMERGADGMPMRFGDLQRNTKNSHSHSNDLRYVLLGDPALRLPGGRHNVVVTHIGDTDLSTLRPDSPLPELAALSSAIVKGYVALPDGTRDDSFNGALNLQLYDAERVVTTHGNQNGPVLTYNDRDQRLSMTNTSVRAGQWEATVHIPPEIQGNYSPAMLSAYAWSERGEEATGACRSLYVFGYDDAQGTDTVGPAIEKLYVNRPDFASGDAVCGTPVLVAHLRDESGINISQSGIGHSMTLTVDGRDHHNGLSQYYEQDPDQPDFGILAYPIEGLAPGRHTLLLTAWDNANNVSKAEIEINLATTAEPAVLSIEARNDQTAGVMHLDITLDRPNSAIDCEYSIHDLNGRRLWEKAATETSDRDSRITTDWDYRDQAGHRVPRGIYIYRVRIETPEGTWAVRSRKIAVGAE